MQRIKKDEILVPVMCDYVLTVGGPDGPIQIIRRFKKGEGIRVCTVSMPGIYPDEYEINDLVGRTLSRGVISSFLPGFERSTTAPVA